MNQNGQKLTAWFDRFEHRMHDIVPDIIAETATEYYKESFTRKSFAGKAWDKVKKPVKKGSLMVRSAALMGSIRPSLVTSNQIRISAGNSRVRYAKIHNEGGTITRASRSETFKRNRVKAGKRKGRFKKGTTNGKGFTFKEYSYKMPQRQFMGHAAELNKRIIKRLKGVFNR